MKAQVVSDFVAEFTSAIISAEHNSSPREGQTENDVFLCWTLFIDGSSNQAGSVARLLLVSPLPEQIQIDYALQMQFSASNNEAEYKALITGLKLAIALGVHHINIYSDS